MNSPKVDRLTAKVDENSAICPERCDGLEQYTRRNTLELHGVPMTRGESTNDIAIDIFQAMGVDVTYADICRSHRNFTRRRRGNRNLPPIILVKLIRHDIKQIIYDNREVLRYLPGYRNIYVNENLTKSRRKLYGRVRTHFPHFKCTTNDGKIYLSGTNFNGGKKYRINCTKDYQALLEMRFSP